MIKYHKSILVAIAILCFVAIGNPLNPVVYYFSESWINKDKIEALESKALSGDCNSAKELAYHYRKANFGFGFGSKGSAWLMFSDSILCGENHGNIYDLSNDKVNTTIHLLVKGGNFLKNNIPKMYEKLKNYFTYFPKNNPCSLSAMHASKIFGENCIEALEETREDIIFPKAPTR
jgi:hypothetical protein